MIEMQILTLPLSSIHDYVPRDQFFNADANFTMWTDDVRFSVNIVSHFCQMIE